jgi:hypothetical protein
MKFTNAQGPRTAATSVETYQGEPVGLSNHNIRVGWKDWAMDVGNVLRLLGQYDSFDLSRPGVWYPWLRRQFNERSLPGAAVKAMLSQKAIVEGEPRIPLIEEMKEAEWEESVEDQEARVDAAQRAAERAAARSKKESEPDDDGDNDIVWAE